MVYREVTYRGDGNESLNTLMRRLKEIEDRGESIIRFEIVTIG